MLGTWRDRSENTRDELGGRELGSVAFSVHKAFEEFEELSFQVLDLHDTKHTLDSLSCLVTHEFIAKPHTLSLTEVSSTMQSFSRGLSTWIAWLGPPTNSRKLLRVSARVTRTSSSSSIRSKYQLVNHWEAREREILPRMNGRSSFLVLSGPRATAMVPRLLTEVILSSERKRTDYLFFWSSLFNSSISTAIG